MDFLTKFPAMERADLRDLKKGIDSSFKEFSRSWGESIEVFFDPLFYFLVRFEKLLLATPWPIIILIVAALSYVFTQLETISGSCSFIFVNRLPRHVE